MIPSSYEYVKAFLKNCPKVKLDKDEKEELRRLFSEALYQILLK